MAQNKALKFVSQNKKGIGISLGFISLILVFVFFRGFIKNLLVKFGLLQSPEEKAMSEHYSKGEIDLVNGANAAVKKQYAVQASTKTDQQWLIIANQCYDDMRYANTWFSDNNLEDAGYQVCRVQNDTDVIKLISAFGLKEAHYFGIIPTSTMDLSGFIHHFFDADKINAVNKNYNSKGIKFKW